MPIKRTIADLEEIATDDDLIGNLAADSETRLFHKLKARKLRKLARRLVNKRELTDIEKRIALGGQRIAKQRGLVARIERFGKEARTQYASCWRHSRKLSASLKNDASTCCAVGIASERFFAHANGVTQMIESSLLSSPKLWRDRAEETLTKAAETYDRQSKARLLRIAQEYERLAEWAERRHSDQELQPEG